MSVVALFKTRKHERSVGGDLGRNIMSSPDQPGRKHPGSSHRIFKVIINNGLPNSLFSSQYHWLASHIEPENTLDGMNDVLCN